MKNIIGFLAIAIVLSVMACTDRTSKVTKEVIVVPSSPTIIVKDPPSKNTTISLDKNGVKVETKKLDVNIKKP